MVPVSVFVWEILKHPSLDLGKIESGRMEGGKVTWNLLPRLDVASGVITIIVLLMKQINRPIR